MKIYMKDLTKSTGNFTFTEEILLYAYTIRKTCLALQYHHLYCSLNTIIIATIIIIIATNL